VALVRTDVVTSRRNLESAWSSPGYWSGVAASDKDGTIYAAVPGADAVSIPPFAKVTLPGHIRNLDYNGNIKREISIPAFRSVSFVVAHFSGSREPVFVSGSYTGDVHAFDEKGNLLWIHPVRQGAADVAVVDSPGNNFNGVIAGFAGNTGVHVLDSYGK